MTDIRFVISSPGSRTLSVGSGETDDNSDQDTFSIPGPPRFDSGQDALLYRNWRNRRHLKESKSGSVCSVCLGTLCISRRTATFCGLTWVGL